MERRELIIAALAAAGENAAFAPVQVQKLFFLLDREAHQLLGGPHFAFAPYDYGPFDRQLYEELERLEWEGLVAIDHSRRYRLYRLTSQGYSEGVQELNKVPEPARTCQAMVRGYEPVQLVGGIIQGDRQVAISNAEIAHAQWPGPPRNGDRCVIDGRTTTIQACDTRRLRNEIVLHLIQVRG